MNEICKGNPCLLYTSILATNQRQEKRYLNKRATKSISCSSFSIPVLLFIRSSIISLNFQFSIFNYLSMFTNRPAIDTRIESELTQRVVPVSYTHLDVYKRQHRTRIFLIWANASTIRCIRFIGETVEQLTSRNSSIDCGRIARP